MNQIFTRLLIIITFFTGFLATVYADEIYLKNGDKISGQIAQEEQDSLSVETEAMGLIAVKRDLIGHIVRAQKSLQKDINDPTDITWKREVALGYNYATGNTRESQFSGNFLLSRKNKHIDEWTAKGNMYYSSAKRKMDAHKWYGMGRYAYSFGSMKGWYNFYRVEADHDRFADIDYRFVPAAGVGYWFYDLPKLKLLLEAGAGYEHTSYRSNIKDKGNWVLVPRAFFEKELFTNTKIRQDVSYYPAFEDFSDYRIHSETILDIAMNQKLSLRISLIDDYNADPPADTKDNDLRVISSLAYSF